MNTAANTQNITEIINAINGGRKLSHIALELKIDTFSLSKLLAQHNFYYEDVLEFRRMQKAAFKTAKWQSKMAQPNATPTLEELSEKEKALANNVLSQLEAGKPFAQVCREFSIGLRHGKNLLKRKGTFLSHVLSKQKQDKLKALKTFTTEEEVKLKQIIELFKSGKYLHDIKKESGLTLQKIKWLLWKKDLSLSDAIKMRETTTAQTPQPITTPATSVPKVNPLYTPLQIAVLSDINHLWMLLGNRPSITQTNQYCLFKSLDMARIIGHWSTAVKIVAEYTERRIQVPFQMSKEEIAVQFDTYVASMINPVTDRKLKRQQTVIALLQNIASKKGYVPIKKELVAAGVYMRIYRAFGSLQKACEAAGLKRQSQINVEKTANKHVQRLVSREQLVAEFAEICKQTGQAPEPDKIENNIPYKKTKFGKQFPNYSFLCKKAGYPVYYYKGNTITPAQMLVQLKNLSLTIGRVPTINDISRHLSFSYMAYVRYFGKLGNALVKADVISTDELLNNTFYAPKKKKIAETQH